MMYQCGRCGLTRASGQEMGVIAQCKCPWEFVPPVAPQRTWVGLDHHDKKTFSSWLDHKSDDEVFKAIEEKLKELNT